PSDCLFNWLKRTRRRLVPKNRLFSEAVRYAGETECFAAATTLLKVAASARNAMSLVGSLTFAAEGCGVRLRRLPPAGARWLRRTRLQTLAGGRRRHPPS